MMKVLCVTHGSLILEIQNILSGYLDDSVSYNTRPKAKSGSFYVYEIKQSEDGQMTVDVIIENDDSHLSNIHKMQEQLEDQENNG
jgi:hypothetical protein